MGHLVKARRCIGDLLPGLGMTLVLWVGIMLYLLLISCSGGSSSPEPPREFSKVVSTSHGDVLVQAPREIVWADEYAIAQEIREGVGRARALGYKDFSLGFKIKLVYIQNPAINGRYFHKSRTVWTINNWRAIDHEIIHHFCHTNQGTGCLCVDHPPGCKG